MKYSKYNNIFNYYRGQSCKINNVEEYYHKQIEDNTTKALINTLMYVSDNVKQYVINELGYPNNKVVEFELQPSLGTSRPDALIITDKNEIYIESKVASSLEEDQIVEHQKNIKKSELLIITNNDNDKVELKTFNINFSKINIITWNDLNVIFQLVIKTKTINKKDEFIINQFLEYLEDNNMAEFNGWKQKDFDAFLFVEEDKDAGNRKNVKERFISFMDKTLIKLISNNTFSDFTIAVQGSIKKDDKNIWGNLLKNGLKNTNVAHFWVSISANGFSVGLNNEGKNNTAMGAFIKNLRRNYDDFTEICTKLDGFYIHLKERYNYKGIPRDWRANSIAQINLGNKYTSKDTEYIINKITELNDSVEITVIKEYKRDNKEINNILFIDKCVMDLNELEAFYKFNLKQ